MGRGFAVMCALAAVLACTVEVCQARQWEVSPLIGYTFGGSFEEEDSGTDLDINESPSVALAIDMEYEPDSQIEFYYSRQSTELEVDGDFLTGTSDDTLFDLDVHYLQIGGTYMWQEKVNGFQPYVAGGLGITHFDPRDSSYDPATRPSLSLGLGARYWLTDHVGIRAEGRGFATLFNGGGSAFSNTEGLTIIVNSNVIGQFVVSTGLFFDF